MIHVYCNLDTGTYNFKFSKDIQHFSDVVALLKEQYHCGYNEKFQEWFTIKALLAKNIIADLQAYDKIDISKEDRQLIDEMIYPMDSNYKKVKAIANNEWLNNHPPITGKLPYENYQLDTLKFCLVRNRFIQDLAPGTGKSYITEALIASLQKSSTRILWVCRPEGVYVTYLKVMKFLSEFYTENELGIVDTDHREIENYFDKKILFTNYTTFRLSHDYYEEMRNKNYTKNKQKRNTRNKKIKEEKLDEKLSKRKLSKPYIDFSSWGNVDDLVIFLDEGQSIKNYDSLQCQAIQVYKDFFNIRGVLSGSLGYKVLDYFSICKFLVPESIPYSWSEFRNYMSVQGTYYSKYVPHRVKEFKEKVLNELQISYSDEVLDLPPFIETEIFIRMTEKMKLMYHTFVDETIQKLIHNNGDEEINGKQLDNSFIYMSMFTSDPILIKDKFHFDDWNITDNPKIEITESLLEKYIVDENRKVVIWSNHPMVINELAKIFSVYKPYVIHGDEKTSISKLDRDKEIEDFRTNKKRNLLICSYVLNSSIDLYEATREIYFDNIVDNDKRNQSKKRLHRLGQHDTVEAIYLLFEDSIDIYIYYEILQRKDKVRSIMISKKDLSLEDYKSVFNAKVQNYWR